MQHTLVAVFDNRADARKALEELVSAGYSRGQARLSEGDPAGETSLAPETGTASRSAKDDGSILSGIRHFFNDIFGTERREDARLYTDAVTRGHYVLTVTASSMDEVERAADLVERFGPIDIDEHAQQWSGGIMPGQGQPRSGARQHAQPMSQQYAPGEQQGADQGAQQRASQDVQQRADNPPQAPRQDERGGMRFYQRIIDTVDQDGDDIYFRGHWSSIYANEGGMYEDYLPAYTYGSTMARSEPYRGRAWDDVENNLRTDWEQRNPGSAWERVKAAIRHGWERITS